MLTTRHKKFLRESYYVNLYGRAMSHVWWPILLMISRREVLSFHITSFIRRKKALETGNVPLFKLLLKMKFILTRQTRRVFASGLFTKTRDSSTCVTIIDRFSWRFRDEVLNFHISGSIWRKKALETGKCSVVYALNGNKIHFDAPNKTGFCERITSLSDLERQATHRLVWQ